MKIQHYIELGFISYRKPRSCVRISALWLIPVSIFHIQGSRWVGGRAGGMIFFFFKKKELWNITTSLIRSQINAVSTKSTEHAYTFLTVSFYNKYQATRERFIHYIQYTPDIAIQFLNFIFQFSTATVLSTYVICFPFSISFVELIYSESSFKLHNIKICFANPHFLKCT